MQQYKNYLLNLLLLLFQNQAKFTRHNSQGWTGKMYANLKRLSMEIMTGSGLGVTPLQLVLVSLVPQRQKAVLTSCYFIKVLMLYFLSDAQKKRALKDK